MISNKTHMSNFHPLEVVGRGRETQLQVGEKLIYYPNRFKDEQIMVMLFILSLITMYHVY